jgi:hypothetical protein
MQTINLRDQLNLINFFYKSYYVGVIIPETGTGNQYAGVAGLRFSLSSH